MWEDEMADHGYATLQKPIRMPDQASMLKYRWR